MAEADKYDAIWSDMLSKQVVTRESSPVLGIHRMHFQLDELHTDLLLQPEVVEQMVVFADIVEISRFENLTLPGLYQIIIVCRILVVNLEECTLSLPYLGEKLENGIKFWDSKDVIHGVDKYEMSSQFQGSIPVQFFIHSQQVVGGRLLVQAPKMIVGADVEVLSSESTARTGLNWWFYFLSSSPYNHRGTRRGVASLVPTYLVVDPTVVMAMQSALLTAETVLCFPRDISSETMSATYKHLEWLNAAVLQKWNETPANHEVHGLKLRTDLLSAIPVPGSTESVLVPRLDYRLYDSAVESIVDVARLYDDAFRALDLFIQQNEINGIYLLDQMGAYAAKEKDVEESNDILMGLKEKELDQAMTQTDALSKQMEQQQNEMDEAKDAMDKGIKVYRDRMVAQAVFSVLKAVFSVALTFTMTGGISGATAVADAAKAVGEAAAVARGLAKVVEMLAELEKVIEVGLIINNLFNTVKEAQLPSVTDIPTMPNMPTEADWAIFENEIEAVAAEMPTEVSEVNVWKAKCKNVAAVGRQICLNAAQISDVRFQVIMHMMEAQIARAQRERLESLKPQDLTNYQEMATQLQMRTTRILLMLAHVLALQKGALHYHYLLPLELLGGSPTMSSVLTLIARQRWTVLTAQTGLNYSTEVEESCVFKDIPVQLLLSGDDFYFTISVDDPTSIEESWQRVRIRYLEMTFTGERSIQPTTDTGRVYILLQADRDFQDRYEDNVFHYEASVAVQYPYAYDLATLQPTLTNRPSPSDVGLYMQMTPFTRWRLRLSASAPENRGLTFLDTAPDATTEITIKFYLTTIRKIHFKTEAM
ncbi:hypothetical protein L7F22_063282 [Adiantum nelumboides]|nr:hypothetical protein [Adiantum nelumboides]